MRLLPLVAAICLPLALAQRPAQAPIRPDPAAAAAPATTSAPSLIQRLVKAVVVGQTVDIAARDADDKATGVERVTDGNYASLVRPAEDEVWVLFVHGPPDEPMTALYQPVHTNASALVPARLAAAARDPESANAATRKGAGKTYRFGRIDFSTEPEVCTRWLITKPPYLVFITHNATRFLQPRAVPPSGETLADLVLGQGWATLAPWNSRYGPGGDRAWLVELYLKISTLWMEHAGRVPNIVWMLLSGWVGQRIIAWLHGTNGAPPVAGTPAAAARARAAAAPRTPAAPAAARVQAEGEAVASASGADAGAGAPELKQRK